MMVNLDVSDIADIATASEAYASRFSGAVGSWLLAVQEKAVLELIGAANARSILDVGGGHGQLAFPLVREGFALTVAGSSDECCKRVQPLLESGRCAFVKCNFPALPFADASFDIVVSVRYLSHSPHWQQMISEMCRVARKAVILDYPRLNGFNLLAGPLFALKKRLEGNTRNYLSFTDEQIREAFEQNAFKFAGQRNQFCLPMVLHRILKQPGLSAWLEKTCQSAGIAACFGTPAVIRMER